MITSLRNAHVQRARKLHKRGIRDRTREFLVEGPTAVREALAAGADLSMLYLDDQARPGVEEVAAAAERAGVPAVRVSQPVMRAISDATTPPGIVAIAAFVDAPSERLAEAPLGLVVVLADVRDPGNLGTILRSAWAVGADAAFLARGTADAYNPKVVRASAGALFHVPFAREVALGWLVGRLRDRGVRCVAADPRAGAAYDEIDMRGPCALLFGNEARGLPEEVAGEVDLRARIPMQGAAESLNVAVAAALFLFEASRQRRSA